MNNNDLTSRHVQLLRMMHELPKRAFEVHERGNGAEFLLHQLCHAQHFNVAKAAYFVENPDFQCLKGIAGYCQEEVFGEWDALWHRPQEFTLFMASAPFNQRVRAIFQEHLTEQQNSAGIVATIATELGITDPAYCTWDLKHYNHGYLVYQRSAEHDDLMQQFFSTSLHILSFCPVF
ncbi:hypothetical protein M1466_02705 [Candidatus Dependentiae bacterium]|nr:hypothetical protein [Candidatus Dependentiae bacterium]